MAQGCVASDSGGGVGGALSGVIGIGTSCLADGRTCADCALSSGGVPYLQSSAQNKDQVNLRI
jgi:hypothetical protein